MKHETLQQALEAMEIYQRTLSAYNHAMGVLYLDATTAAPSDSWEGRNQTMEVLSEVIYNLDTSPEIEQWLSVLEENKDHLTALQKRQVEVIRKNYDKTKKIPAKEYVEFTVLQNEAQSVWQKAKNENDFAAFAPYLERIVEFNREFAGYYNAELPIYDALLNEYEEGLTMETLDAFFAQLRTAIVPLIHAISKKEQIDDSFLYRNYPIAVQRDFSDYLMEVMGMDRSHCGIAETEHPYTTNFNNKDVRITTHYYENNLVSSMFSVIHDG